MRKSRVHTSSSSYPHIGELRHRITFQEAVETDDGIGGRTRVFQDIATTPTVWAVITPRSDGERFFKEKIEQTVTHVIRIRWRNDLDTAMQIVFEGRVFQIQKIVAMHERKDFLRIEANEGERS